MKYIDADKLLAEIERQQRKLTVLSFRARQLDMKRDCALQNGVYEHILGIIASLQQERLFSSETIEEKDRIDEGFTKFIQKRQEQSETDMKSPFTGGKVAILSREEEVTFRGEKVKIIRKYYRCEDTGREFTDSKLDDDMMWSVFRAYCEKKGMTSFADIMLKQEQLEVPSGEDVMIMCNQILIDWVKEGKSQEEKEQREQAHVRFFELYDDYLMQEQPEGDLEKEICRWMDKLDDKYCMLVDNYSMQDIKDTARHFWNKGYNARKEETK